MKIAPSNRTEKVGKSHMFTKARAPSDREIIKEPIGSIIRYFNPTLSEDRKRLNMIAILKITNGKAIT